MQEENKLTITIKNSKPIELNQFASSLDALSAQYDSFLKNPI
jgi:hypothetical protein